MADHPQAGDIKVHLPQVKRERGPYEITITHVTPRVTTTITLDPETNRARAIKNGHAQLAQCAPGAQVMVHRWEKGAHPTAEPSPEQLVYHAHLDEQRHIRLVRDARPVR